MNFNIYKCWFKGDTYIKVTSDQFIEHELEQNSRKKSDLEIHLQKDDPKGFNDYLAELYDPNKHLEVFYETISYDGTLKEDISVFNHKIAHLNFYNVSFMDAKLDAVYFSNLYLVKELYINGTSKGNIDFLKFINLEAVSILKWNEKIKLVNSSSSLKSLIVWYYNSKSKSLNDLLGELKSIEYLELNLTNIESLDGIEKLQNLKIIKINYGRNLKSVIALNCNKKLELIYLNNCKKMEDFDSLDEREGLKIQNLKLPG
ncbi:hypothetical protein B0A67_13195 [Flavobacterium aquidurense]|uniref:hypothetical protein n=1 Tax=Flavobacterium aquidurense TaxID=362413 RepID=UPI00092026B0|nr:hypothetical protein [Flavobacterium aquidurense]OXA71214.1 hypothetical protein B0A67_13195 [Flavobacterium aquidurense]SHG68501.1 hypothetical protein SAMN05444481_106188 [Flavobacterium frigidimaris]